jgi:hypothetical protein
VDGRIGLARGPRRNQAHTAPVGKMLCNIGFLDKGHSSSSSSVAYLAGARLERILEAEGEKGIQ